VGWSRKKKVWLKRRSDVYSAIMRSGLIGGGGGMDEHFVPSRKLSWANAWEVMKRCGITGGLVLYYQDAADKPEKRT